MPASYKSTQNNLNLLKLIAHYVEHVPVCFPCLRAIRYYSSDQVLWPPKHDEDPSNKILKVLDVRSISTRKHEWDFGSMGLISTRKDEMEFW